MECYVQYIRNINTGKKKVIEAQLSKNRMFSATYLTNVCTHFGVILSFVESE